MYIYLYVSNQSGYTGSEILWFHILAIFTSNSAKKNTRQILVFYNADFLRGLCRYWDSDDEILKDVFLFIAYCVTEFKTVFHGLLFWRFLFLMPIVPNENTRQI